jgi:hypothetical protein
MIIQPMIDQIFRNPRRNDDSRNTRAISFKREAVLVEFVAGTGIAGRFRRRRRTVVVKPAVLVPRDDEHAIRPYDRRPNALVRCLYQPLAARDIRQRVLGCPVPIFGSPQEFITSGILRGFPVFLKSDVFGVGHGHAPGFQ